MELIEIIKNTLILVILTAILITSISFITYKIKKKSLAKKGLRPALTHVERRKQRRLKRINQQQLQQKVLKPNYQEQIKNSILRTSEQIPIRVNAVQPPIQERFKVLNVQPIINRQENNYQQNARPNYYSNNAKVLENDDKNNQPRYANGSERLFKISPKQ